MEVGSIPFSRGSPSPGIEPRSLAFRAKPLPTELQGKPKNTGVGSLSFLQGILWTQESNWGLLHCRRILYQLSYHGSPSSVQSLSRFWVAFLSLCNPMDCSTPGLPVHHQLPEFTQTHADWVGDAIQPSHPLSSPSSPAPNPSQHQGLFQWVGSLHQVAKVLEFQLQHQSLQWIVRTDFL